MKNRNITVILAFVTAAFPLVLDACVFSLDKEPDAPLEGVWMGYDVFSNPVEIVFSGNTMTMTGGSDMPITGQSTFKDRGDKLDITPSSIWDSEAGKFIPIEVYTEKSKNEALAEYKELLDKGIITQTEYVLAVANIDALIAVEPYSIPYALRGNVLTFYYNGIEMVLVKQ
jgi:hypothetical protein